MTKIYPLILCGGSGTRLWPMSRTRSPKQFQKIHGENSVTFFQAAIQRHRGEHYHDPVIVTGLRHRGTVVSQLREIQVGSQIICEPMARNTGPAVLAAAHMLQGRDANAVIIVIPADHVIEGDLTEAIASKIDAAVAGHIVTFGIEPRSPETGFGYIAKGKENPDFPGLFGVKGFVEKPPKARAKELVDGKGAFWASGISMFSAKTLIEEYEKFDAESAAHAKRSVTGASMFPEALYLDADEFSQTDPKPTEMVVFENSDRMATVPLDVTWNDVGSWAAMHTISKPDSDGNVLQGNVVALDSKNTLVRAEQRLVSIVGLEDVIIVDTKDALLVTKMNKSQAVKDVVGRLKKEGRAEAEYYAHSAPKLVPMTVPAGLEQIMHTDNIHLGTTEIPIGACIDMEIGNGRQVIVVKGSVHAQGPTWQKTVREGGRIYSDPDGPIRIANCADVETELLFMTFEIPVESPKSVPLEQHG